MRKGNTAPTPATSRFGLPRPKGLVISNDYRSIPPGEAIPGHHEHREIHARQEGVVTEFDPVLWHTMVDVVTVYSREDVRFRFKDGTEIKAFLKRRTYNTAETQ